MRSPETQAPVSPQIDNEPDAPYVAGRPSMITYPFPIRPGLQGTITLPENLSQREAKRIFAFVAALVSEEEEQATPQGEQPQQQVVADQPSDT
jgi:hypothetical protein